MNDYLVDAADVTGIEEYPNRHLPIVPVVVEGPVRTEPLPSRLGNPFTKVVKPANRVTANSSGDATYRVNADQRRRRCTILSTDQPFYYGGEQASVENGTAALWPINVPLVIEHTSEFFLASANAAGSTLSIIPENWTQ